LSDAGHDHLVAEQLRTFRAGTIAIQGNRTRPRQRPLLPDRTASRRMETADSTISATPWPSERT